MIHKKTTTQTSCYNWSSLFYQWVSMFWIWAKLHNQVMV